MIRQILISLCFLAFFYNILAADDEFYCRVLKDNWKVCRRCNETYLDCDGTSEPQDKCRCEDIQLKDPTKEKGMHNVFIFLTYQATFISKIL